MKAPLCFIVLVMTFSVFCDTNTTEHKTGDTMEVEVQTVDRSTSYVTMAEPIAASDLQCLQELPVDELLKIRKSLRVVSHMMTPGDRFDYDDDDEGTFYDDPLSRGYLTENGGYVGSDGYSFDFNHTTGSAQAQPLMMNKIKEKVGYDDGWVEEKPSKVQKIFQLSVTTLAFFAFGGYLLCMIVQAIKSKGTTYFHPALLPMTTATETTASIVSQYPYKRKRPARHRRYAETKNATESSFNLAGPSPDALYNILVLAAEGYVNLGQLK